MNRELKILTFALLVLAVAVAAITIIDSDDSDASSTFIVDDIKYETISDSTVKVVSNSPKYSGPVTIPSTVTYSDKEYSVTSIGDSAFYGCTSLTSVTIGNSVTSMGGSAFYGCTSLTSVNIPDSVTSIGSYAFLGCTSLTEINVSEDNINYCSVGGVLFDKGKTQLMAYPVGKTDSSYIIPDGVKSIGDYSFFQSTSLTTVDIPDSVTSIGKGSFRGCTFLNSVDIPDSVTSISDYAFQHCTSITSLTLDVKSIGKYAFDGCTSLASVTIPDGVTSIGSFAFMRCPSLTSVTIPNSVTSIGTAPFDQCTSLKEINVSENNAKYCSVDGVLFDKGKTLLLQYPAEKTDSSYIIPGSVKRIIHYAFKYCASLTSVDIPSSVTFIGVGVFSYCTSLKEINVSEDNANYCSVDGVLFNKGKTQLIAYPVGRSDTSYTIPDGVTAIGSTAYSEDNVFGGCTSLISATIPNTVTSICLYSFNGCTSLKEINVSEDNANYCSVSGVLFNKGKTQLIAYPVGRSDTSYTIPDGVTSIGKYAFYGCTSLASVTIPDGVTSIGGYAFHGCTSLASVTIPDSVTSIAGLVFFGCTSLTSVTISDSVESIDFFAFYLGTSDHAVTCYVYGCSEKKLDMYKNAYTTFIYNKFFTVTFDSAGGSSVPSLSLQIGSTVTKPADPTRDYYVFIGWYNGDEIYDFSTPITSDVTLTAHWTEFDLPSEDHSSTNIIAAAIVLAIIGVLLVAVVFRPKN